MRALNERPIMRGHARLRYDRSSGRFFLLSPERGILLNRTAHEVLELCAGGTRSLAQLIGELHERYPEVATLELEHDVCELFDALERRALVRFEP